MELHINSVNNLYNGITRIECSKTNKSCDKSSVFVIDFLENGEFYDSGELLNKRVGSGLKLFKADIKRLQAFGVNNINQYDFI